MHRPIADACEEIDCSLPLSPLDGTTPLGAAIATAKVFEKTAVPMG
jgi:hypothetical protein